MPRFMARGRIARRRLVSRFGKLRWTDSQGQWPEKYSNEIGANEAGRNFVNDVWMRGVVFQR